VPDSPFPAHEAPAAVHIPRMQQPAPLQAFAPQQTCPASPHGVPFGRVVALEPHDDNPTKIPNATARLSHFLVE
jgi:hypothetical protein